MSVVTGVMLLLGAGDWDEGQIAEVHEWLRSRDYHIELRDVSEYAGGNKHPQFEAWCAGINGFVDEDAFAEFVTSREWSSPENLLLIMQPEQGPSRVFFAVGRSGESPVLVGKSAADGGK